MTAAGEPTPGSEALQEALGQVIDADSPTVRTAALARFSGLVFARTGRLAGKVVKGGRPVVDLLVDLVQGLPARDEAALRDAFPGLTAEQLADALTRNASRVTAAVGAAGGGLAAAEWVALPTLAASLLVGLVISVFQAVTSIQEQTLTFVPRLIIVGVVLVLTMPWALEVAIQFTVRMLGLAAEVGR